MKKQAGILLSGGLDSTSNGYLASSHAYKLEVAFFFKYGQIAYLREKESALFWAKYFKIPLVEFDLRAIFQIISGDKPLQQPALQVNLDSETETQKSRNTVWIPNRNGLFINIAAAYLEKRGIKYLLVGFNREEAQTFPDNSSDFLAAINQSLSFSTLNKVELVALTLNNTKREIVSLLKETNFPFEKVWSCYFAKEKMCGVCESCLRFKRALQENNLLEKYREIFNE